jgi:hypothetical protein
MVRRKMGRCSESHEGGTEVELSKREGRFYNRMCVTHMLMATCSYIEAMAEEDEAEEEEEEE